MKNNSGHLIKTSIAQEQDLPSTHRYALAYRKKHLCHNFDYYCQTVCSKVISRNICPPHYFQFKHHTVISFFFSQIESYLFILK